MSQLRIRYAKPADVPSFLSLFKEVMENLGAYYNAAAIKGEVKRISKAYVTEQIRLDKKALSLAFRDGRMVGFCLAQDQIGPILIDWYGVSKSARRQQIGEALLQHRADMHGKNKKTTNLYCWTRVNNHPSMALLNAQKFKKMCRLNNHWYGQDFYLWRREF